uniref:Uncharacterized protein n=1 Tax=viral metagenome TaxID=1070528 RepID=A0A6M3KZN5_9ZZZZ
MSEATVKRNIDNLNKKIDAIVNKKSINLPNLQNFLNRIKGTRIAKG